ncbi:MAG: tyrosinase family protein [Verrucomicrobiota bacterium]
MSAQIFLNFTDDPNRNYIGWSPARCAIRTTDNTPRTVRLRNGDTGVGGQVVFAHTPTGPMQDELDVALPTDNGLAQFYCAGKFDHATGQGYASTVDGDASIQVMEGTNSLMVQRLMVRVRKDAETLTPGERDLFLSALVDLNSNGGFVDFQNMHTSDTSREIHGRSCFLPWHRLYLLDLERKLQAIEASVTLPYWRFDKPAPYLFTEDFIGVPDSTGIVQFSSSNPLVNWRLSVFGEGSGRIRRTYRQKNDGTTFDPTIEGALIDNDESDTLNLGTTNPGTSTEQTNFRNFERMETDPHGRAHTSFRGQVSEIGRAPADPLFFLLHNNVDRLWARWQWLRDRQNPDSSDVYYKRGTGPINPDPRRAHADRIGNFIEDTLWPWNGVVGDPRPRTAPGTYYPASPIIGVPDRYPDIRSAIDFQGQIDLIQNLGFHYDDVPYDFA